MILVLKANSMDEAIKLYEEFSRYPTVSSACISNNEIPGHIKVESLWGQRNHLRKEKMTFSRTHVIQLDSVFSSQPTERFGE